MMKKVKMMLMAIASGTLFGMSPVNQLKSPGFETEGVWHTFAQGGSVAKRLAATESETAIPEGKFCGYIHKIAGGGDVASLAQNVSVKPGKSYRLTGIAKGKGHVLAYYYDTQKHYLGQHPGIHVNCTEWTPLSTVMTLPNNVTSVQIRFEIYGSQKSGKGWLDDLHFSLAPQQPPTNTNVKPQNSKGLSSLNRLLCPGFETEGGWHTYAQGGSKAKRLNASESDKPIPEGNFCAYIHKIAGGGDVVAMSQDVRVEPGKSYQLAGIAKGQAHLLVYFYDAQNHYLGQHPGIHINCGEWNRASTIVKPPKKAAKVQVRFEIYGPTKTGEGWLDDLYFGLIPPKPAQVKNLRATTTKGISLAWTAPTGKDIVDFGIFRSRFPDQEVEHIRPYAISKQTTWQDPAVPQDWERCYYRVCAYNAQHVQGIPSERVIVRLPDKTPEVEPVVWTSSPMTKVRRYQDAPLQPSKVNQRISLKLAKNEAEAVQILVSNKEIPIKQLDVRLTGFDGKLKGALYRVCYTRVKKPTISPERNRPGLFADALPPWQGPISVPEYATQGIWLQLTSALDCPAGSYDGMVTVTGDGKVLANIPVNAEVWNFAVPVTPSFQTAFAVWPDCVAWGFGLKEKSAECMRLYEKYYWFMVEHRLMPNELPVPLLSDKVARYLNDPRINAFGIPVGWGKVDVPTLRKTADYLRKHGWLKKGFVLCFDEPTPAQFPLCRELATKVHEAGKDIRFLLTKEPVKELKGFVDIWTAILMYVDWNARQEAMQAGDEFWWYTCVNPQEPYPTYLIDDRGISHRVLSWLQAKHQIQGVLYWCANICTKHRNHRYQKEVTVWDEAEMFPRGNGDGFLVYPGKQVGVDGPVSSIRLELIRDGNEDVEYIHLLRDLLKKNGCKDIQGTIDSYITPVARTLKDWNKDPKVLEAQRISIAQRILSELKH